jgi:hypothetical protein
MFTSELPKFEKSPSVPVNLAQVPGLSLSCRSSACTRMRNFPAVASDLPRFTENRDKARWPGLRRERRRSGRDVLLDTAYSRSN